MKNEQQRVLGRIMASEIQADVLADVNVGGGTLPTADNGSGSSTYTAGPTPQTSDQKVNRDWPQA